MITYDRLISFGDTIQLDIKCDSDKLVKEISHFKFKQYNTLKSINRYGLSITSIDGEMNGEDLESLYETGLKYNEMSFKKLTDVYYQSEETRKLIDPFREHIGRCHFLSIKKGGYFPPHRDDWGMDDQQQTFRIIVPIAECNAPNFYFIFNGSIINLTPGYAYFMNTNLEHCVFSYTDKNILAVLNIECNDKSIREVMKHMFKK